MSRVRRNDGAVQIESGIDWAQKWRTDGMLSTLTEEDLHFISDRARRFKVTARPSGYAREFLDRADIRDGESVLDIAENVKARKARRFFAYGTYAIFTNGLAKFDKAYEEGLIDGIFGSNLTYLNPELKNRPWFHEVDVSKYIAYFISALNHDASISSLLDPHAKAKIIDEQL